jgi:hypothetical protein
MPISAAKSTDHDLKRLIQLEDVLKSYGVGKVERLRQLAKGLSQTINPPSNWSWNYIHQVSHGKLPLSSKLRIAIRRLHSLLRVSENNQPEMEHVSVIAPIGQIESNTLVAARTRNCKRPGCGIRFIPHSPSQIYHAPSCRIKKSQKKRIEQRG